MHQSVKKIINTDINPFQISIYFNVYMIKSVFIGYGVVDLNKKEEAELKENMFWQELKR